MPTAIQWSEIETECGEYRAGFVVIFRKYEGQATDEKDAQGRTVKVTASSFARHMGIAERTFRAWAKQGGGGGRPAQRDRVAEVLTNAPLEQVEQIIGKLPPERQQAIAAASGHAYHAARQDYAETERNLTPAQRSEREAAGEALTRPVVATVTSFTIIGRLESALGDLREMNASGSVPRTMIDPLDKVLGELNEENRVTRAMAGLEIDLDEVQS